MDYWPANEVEDIIRKYIKYHPELLGANIGCIFREKATQSDGVPIVGKISKVSARYQCLMKEEYDYIIEIGADAWQDLSPDSREAWVDHLLEHAYGEENDKTGEMKWKLRKPEIMIFPNIIHRHGLNWMPGLGKIASLPLPNKEPVVPKVRDEVTTEPSNNDLDDLLSDLN